MIEVPWVDMKTSAVSMLYRDAKPFPHVVLDNFLGADTARQVHEAATRIDRTAWNQDDHSQQVGKTWAEDFRRMPEPLRTVLLWFNSGTFLYFLQNLTGIKDLLPDMGYYGGGVHCTSPGGKLGIHADYNTHPVTHLHRRINALYFLNDNWQNDWGGQLELWDRDMRNCVRKIAPILDRLVVFTITDTAFHGAPQPVVGPVSRYSLALYYFTADRPEHEKSSPHMALWREAGR